MPGKKVDSQRSFKLGSGSDEEGSLHNDEVRAALQEILAKKKAKQRT